MNANELADELEKIACICNDGGIAIKESSTMLRKQQAEIEALEDKLDEAEQRYWNNR